MVSQPSRSIPTHARRALARLCPRQALFSYGFLLPAAPGGDEPLARMDSAT